MTSGAEGKGLGVHGVGLGVNNCRFAKLRGLMYRGKEIRRFDWLKRTHGLEIHTGHMQKNANSDQSHIGAGSSRCTGSRIGWDT